MFKLGEVKIPDDEDFNYIKQIAESNSIEWVITYDKNGTKVWTKKNELSSFNMIRIKADFDDVSAECLYNVLHDGEYRSQWDERMIEGFEIGWLSPNSDIGYYSSNILNLI